MGHFTARCLDLPRDDLVSLFPNCFVGAIMNLPSFREISVSCQAFPALALFSINH